MVTTVLCVAVAQQLSGVEAFMYYSPFLFKQVGFQTRSEILGLTAMMGFAKTVTLVFVACLLDTKGAGRRRMLFWSYVGMAISLFFLAWGSFSSLRGVVVVSIFCYVVMFSVGAGPITWLFSAEIMPTNVRARGMVLATTMNRFAGATIGMTFLSASNASASGALLSFALVCTTCAFFCYVYCPETQGKTLEEMYAAFSKMSGVGMSGRAGAGGRIGWRGGGGGPNIPLSEQGMSGSIELRRRVVESSRERGGGGGGGGGSGGGNNNTIVKS